jgi:dihydroorotase
MNTTVHDMQTTMSKMLAMDVELNDVIRLSTVNPAREIGHPELGHLSVGAVADVAAFTLRSGPFTFTDCGRATLKGNHKLECVFTMRDGDIVFDSGGLSMPDWTQAPASYWKLPGE